MKCPSCRGETPPDGAYCCRCGRALAPRWPRSQALKTGSLAAWLAIAVVCVFVVSVGVNIKSANQRGRVKRTMSDIRGITTAWDAAHQSSGSWCPPGWARARFDWGNLPPRVLARYLADFHRELPLVDAWGRPFEFAVGCAPGQTERFGIRSRGPDGEWATEMAAEGRTGFDHDVVMMDGEFVMDTERYVAQSDIGAQSGRRR